jgi:hypothetical protein
MSHFCQFIHPHLFPAGDPSFLWQKFINGPFLKFMKKIIGAEAGIVLSLGSFAQFNVGIHGTGNLASAKIKFENDFDYSKTMKAMPGAGIVLQVGINKNLAIRSGVNYVQNGVVLKATVDGETSMKIKLENNLHYIQVPVNLLFQVPVSSVKFFAGGGAFFNYGISGKTKSTLTYTMPDGETFTETEKADAFKKEEDGGAGLKKTDFGVAALAGLQFGKLFVNVGYQLSLSNSADAEGGEYKNRGLQLTLGTFF